MGMEARIRMLTICAALVLLFWGCASVASDWKAATQMNTLESYEEFMNNHPDSEYTARAGMLVETLHWKAAAKVNTVEAYENFLRLQPNAKIFKLDAVARITRMNEEALSQKAETLEKKQSNSALKKDPGEWEK